MPRRDRVDLNLGLRGEEFCRTQRFSRCECSGNSERKSLENFLGPGVWVKPWDSLVDAYSNLRVCGVIGIRGIDGEFYAFFQRDAAFYRNVIDSVEPVLVSEQLVRDKIPVFVDVVEGTDDIKVSPLPSVVWFDSSEKVYPGRPNTAYLSLFDGLVKTIGSGFLPTDGERNIVQQFSGQSLVSGDRVGQVIERTSEIMDNVPYYAYKRSRDGLRLDKERFLDCGRLRIGDGLVSVVPQEQVKTGLEIFDVLLGPLVFVPGARYVSRV